MKAKKFKNLIPVLALIVAGAVAGCSGSNNTTSNTNTNTNTGSEVNTETNETGTETGTDDTVISEIPESGLTVRLAELDFFRIAQEQGFFDEEFAGENITFEYAQFQGGAYINEAMASDSVDFGAMWEQPAITAVANGYPEKIVATYGYSDTNAPLIVTKKSGITKLEDLKGKKIGVILGGSFHYTALKYIEQAGLTANDVELINTTDPLTLLRSGDIDAAVTFNMYAQQVIEDGTCEQLAIGKDYGLMAVYTVVGNQKFIETYPETTARILKVLDKTIKYTAENTETAYTAYAEYVQQDYNVLLTNYQSSHYELDLSQEDVDAMKQVEKFLEDLEIISSRVDIKDAVDTTYLEKAGVEVNVQY